MGVSRQQIEKVPHGMGHGISLCRHLIGMRADSRLSFGVRVFARTYAPEGPLGFGLPPYANNRRLPSFTKMQPQDQVQLRVSGSGQVGLNLAHG